MGCTCSKGRRDNEANSNPLQKLQATAASPAPRTQQHRRRQEEKRQRQLAKLQKRNARKCRHQGVDARSRVTASGSLRHKLRHSGGSSTGSIGSIGRTAQAGSRQLCLRGGSNGSTATECISVVYARTLEKQHEEQQRNMELKTRHQLERQLDMFLLNQLLLSVQFFGHYEHELAAIEEQFVARQRACAQTMSEHSLLQANAIDAAVARRVLFKPR